MERLDRDQSVRFATRVIELLKEFSKKYKEMRTEARGLRHEFRTVYTNTPLNSQPLNSLRNEYSAHQARLMSLHPSSIEMVQQSNQVLRNGQLPPEMSLELGLRLADFEGEMQFTMASVINGQIEG